MSFNTILYTCIIDWNNNNKPTIGERPPDAAGERSRFQSLPKLTPPSVVKSIRTLDISIIGFHWSGKACLTEANLPQLGLWLNEEKNDQKIEAWLIRDSPLPLSGMSYFREQHPALRQAFSLVFVITLQELCRLTI